MLEKLLTQWAQVGTYHEDPDCRPPEFADRMTGSEWNDYAESVDGCGDTGWRDLVIVTGLLHDRIRHMMWAMMEHAL